MPETELNARNFTLYAAQHYTNKRCLDPKEFYEDLAHFKYIKKLLKRYDDDKELQERLILNHIIIAHNVFTLKAATAMCFFKVPTQQWPALKTFLLYLNYIYENTHINIPSDLYVAKKLQQI